MLSHMLHSPTRYELMLDHSYHNHEVYIMLPVNERSPPVLNNQQSLMKTHSSSVQMPSGMPITNFMVNSSYD